MTDDPHDTPTRWGYWVDGEFRVLPKVPMLMANLGPPPFDVTLPSGEVRHVVEEATPVIPGLLIAGQAWLARDAGRINARFHDRSFKANGA